MPGAVGFIDDLMQSARKVLGRAKTPAWHNHARRATGLTLSDLAAELGHKRPANIILSIQRYRERIQEGRAERSRAQRAAKMLNVSI